MRFSIALLFLLLACAANSRELPWIGVSLSPAQEEERKAVDLDPEIGFSVSRVISGSPLAQAGGWEGDLWWKFDDQILVNKRQMVVLLRTKSPGEKVKVNYYREGILKNLTLTLGEPQRKSTYLIRSEGEKAPYSARVLTKRERVARLSRDGHDLSLRREGEGWRFEVRKGKISVISSLVSGNDLSEMIPVKWQESYLILKLTLGGPPLDGSSAAGKRVRYVPRCGQTSTK